MKHFSPFQKYIVAVWLILLSSFFNIIAAQSGSIRHYSPNHKKQLKRHAPLPKCVPVLLLGIGAMHTGNNSGTLSVSLPYETIDSNWVRTAHVFNGNSNHLFSKQSAEALFGIDISRPLYAFNFSLGKNITYKGAFYSVGFGVNLYLGQFGNSLEEKTNNCNWIIRPSININFFSFSTGTIGTINNSHTTIYILDSEAKPTYTYSSSSGRHSYTHTANANNLLVSYKQNQLGIEPKIAFCSNPYKKSFTIQIFASYFIPIYESSGLKLKQDTKTGLATNFLSGSFKNSLNHHNEINATYNNHVFNTVAFHANHIYIGVTFGIPIK